MLCEGDRCGCVLGGRVGEVVERGVWWCEMNRGRGESGLIRGCGIPPDHVAVDSFDGVV